METLQNIFILTAFFKMPFFPQNQKFSSKSGNQSDRLPGLKKLGINSYLLVSVKFAMIVLLVCKKPFIISK
jgi:hypothetical protein